MIWQEAVMCCADMSQTYSGKVTTQNMFYFAVVAAEVAVIETGCFCICPPAVTY